MRKRSRKPQTMPLLGALAVGAWVAVGVGCSNSTPTQKPVDDPAQPVAAHEASPPASDTYRPAQPGAQPAAQPVDPAAARDRFSEREKQEISELEAAVAWTLARANQLRQAGRLERARDQLRDLLNQLQGRAGARMVLQDRIAEVETLLNEIEHMMGSGVGEAPQGMQMSYQQQVQEARQEAHSHFQDGVEAAQAGNYDDAQNSFQRVLEILRWAPYSSDLQEEFKTKTENELRKSQTMARQQQSLDQERMRQLARELEVLHRQQQERQRLEDIEQLWGDALFNMNLKRYSTAERLAEQILALDPSFVKAKDMLDTIQALRLQAYNEANRERKLDMYRRLWADWYEAKIPLAGKTVEYPNGDEWLRIKNRANLGWQDIEDPPAVQKVKSTLATKIVPMNYEETDFPDVIEDITSKSGLTLLVDPEIAPDFEDAPVTLRVNNLPLANSLKIIMDFNELKFVVREDGIVWISSADNPSVTGRMVVRLHDVRDLTVRVRDFPGTRIRLRGNDNGGGGGPIWEDEESPVEPIEVDVLQDIISENIAPDSWGDQATIQTVAGQLLVRNSPEVHNQIREFLQNLRDVSGLVVTITTRFVTIDDMYLSDFGIDIRGLGGQSPGNTVLLDDVSVGAPDNAGGTVDNGANAVPPGAAIAGLFFNDGTAAANRDIRGRFENVFENTLGNLLRTTGGLGLQFTVFQNNDSQFQLVLHALQKSQNATVLTAPRLSAFNTQRANLTVINQVSYIRDFSVQTAISAAVANPIVDTISDGLVLDVKPTVSNDRRFVTIELQPTIAQLVRPIPTFTTTLGGPGSTPVTIQLPELQIQSIQTTVMCPDGGVVVVGGMKSIRDVDRESTTPLLGDIPILGTLFRRKGRSLENRSLIIIVKAVITDLREQEERRP